MSSIPSCTQKLTPAFPAPPKGNQAKEHPTTQSIISALNLELHIEGGYFAEIDRNPLIIPNPFQQEDAEEEEEEDKKTQDKPISGDNTKRNASTSIYYMLTPLSPQGHFHRNKGRTVHTVIEGRGRYVLIHADEEGGKKKRVESFLVGKDVSKGERAVWVVEGGKYKASFLLSHDETKKEEEEEGDGERLLISETVIPGFEYSDHDFLTMDKFQKIVSEEQAEELEWLVRKS